MAIAWAVFEVVMPTGQSAVYVNAQDVVTMQTYPKIPVAGIVPQQYGRGFIFHAEGDHNAPFFMTIDAPQVEGYVPLWQGYTTLTAGETVSGLAPYPFPGTASVYWWLEVVGGGSGSVQVGSTVLDLPATYSRTRIPFITVAPQTALTPELTITGTTTLGGIFLVNTLYTIALPGGS